MPKYEEIANILRDRIANGVYPVDSICLFSLNYQKSSVLAE